MIYFRTLLVILPALFASAESTQGAVVSFNLVWKGEFSSQASAIGTISLDESLLPNPGFSVFSTAAVVSFSWTVTGAVSGNGTYTINDYYSFNWNTDSAPLDLSRELVGQPTLNGTWGFDKGDFSFSSFTGAPSAAAPFLMIVGSSDVLRLTSVSPLSSEIPEPTSMAIFGLGAIGLVYRVRRMGKA